MSLKAVIGIIIAVVVLAGGYVIYQTQKPVTLNVQSADQSSAVATATVTSQTMQITAVATTTASVASSSQSEVPVTGWNAQIIGGQLSQSDRNAIIAAQVKFLAIIQSDNVTEFRQIATIVEPPEVFQKIKDMSDQQLSQLIQIDASLFAGLNAGNLPILLSSSKATWTVQDQNDVTIKITQGSQTITMQAVMVNGVWY